MKEVDVRVEPELIREVFGAVEESITKKEYNDLSEIFSDQDNVIALNSIHPDKSMNIVHYLALNNAGSVALPYLTKYIDTALYKQRDFEGDTPINNAIGSGRLNNAKVLVEIQRSTLREKKLTKSQIDKEIADTVNIQDNKGQTPLHIAAHAHRPEYIKFLLSIGADSSILNNEGKSAVIEAAEEYDGDNRMIKTIACLVKDSQELDTIKYNGKSVIDIISNTQRILWGTFQERELRRECDSNRGTCCTIS